MIGVDISQSNYEEVQKICYDAHLHPEQIICYCTSTRADEVAAAILQGADTPDKISQRTGLRTGCTVECLQPAIRLLDAAGIKLETPICRYQWYGATPTIWSISDEVKRSILNVVFISMRILSSLRSCVTRRYQVKPVHLKRRKCNVPRTN